MGAGHSSWDHTHDSRLLLDNHCVGWAGGGWDTLEKGPKLDVVANMAEFVVDGLTCQHLPNSWESG